MLHLLPAMFLADAASGFALRDGTVVLILLIGVLCQGLRRRMRPGLGSSLLVGLSTIGVAALIWWHSWSPGYQPFFSVRITSLLVVLWASLGRIAAISEHRSETTESPTDSTTFFAWSLVTGIAVLVQVLYVLAFRSLARILDPNLFEAVAGQQVLTSLYDVLALMAALLFWRSARRQAHQPAMLLSLSLLVAWLTALLIPEGTGDPAAGPASSSMIQLRWWDWTIHCQSAFAAVLLLAAVIQDRGYRRSRERAWPDRLDDLLAGYPRWPAYAHIESLAAGVILVLGVYQLVRLGSSNRLLAVASLTACMTAGWTCLFLCYRRWSGNTAGLGMGLLTLAGAQGMGLVSSAVIPASQWMDYSARIPILFNAVLFALALSIVWWRWLAGFWRQQLLDGRDWTTTGRLIPYARRTAFLLSALAMLLTFHMALWPKLAPTNEDDGRYRIAFGLAAIALLLLIAARKARRDDSISSAGLAVALLVGAVLFAFIRLPTSPLRGWLKQYDEVVLGAIALPVLLVAESIPSTRWRAFSSPLWIMAVLFLPAASLVGLLSPDQPVEWIRPMTLAILGALYSFAGRREHRRAFLALGGMLLLASLTTLYRGYGRLILSGLSG